MVTYPARERIIKSQEVYVCHEHLTSRLADQDLGCPMQLNPQQVTLSGQKSK